MENLISNGAENRSILALDNQEFIELLKGDSILEFYTDQQLFRTLVQMIPGIGPLVDVALAIPGTKRKQQRLDLLLWSLYKGLILIEQKLSTQEIEAGRSFMETEAFEDMLSAAIDSSQKTRSREKILMNAMILTNLSSARNDGRYRPEEYINVLAELTSLELDMILIFFRSYDEDTRGESENELGQATRLHAQEKIVEELCIEPDDLEFILKRLERTGLIKEVIGSYYGYNGGRFTATKTLFRLMEYLNDHPFANFRS